MKTMTMKEYLNYIKDSQFVFAELKGKKILLHEFIMEPPKGCKVIHKNKDGLDNRRENLEIVRILNV